MRSLDVLLLARTRWTSHHVTTDFSVSRATVRLLVCFPLSLISHVTLLRYASRVMAVCLDSPYVIVMSW